MWLVVASASQPSPTSGPYGEQLVSYCISWTEPSVSCAGFLPRPLSVTVNAVTLVMDGLNRALIGEAVFGHCPSSLTYRDVTFPPSGYIAK